MSSAQSRRALEVIVTANGVVRVRDVATVQNQLNLTDGNWHDIYGVDFDGAVLVRPDGYVARAADTFETCAEDRLHTALQRWFGVSVAERGAARRDGGLSSAPATERTA